MQKHLFFSSLFLHSVLMTMWEFAFGFFFILLLCDTSASQAHLIHHTEQNKQKKEKRKHYCRNITEKKRNNKNEWFGYACAICGFREIVRIILFSVFLSIFLFFFFSCICTFLSALWTSKPQLFGLQAIRI